MMRVYSNIILSCILFISCSISAQHEKTDYPTYAEQAFVITQLAEKHHIAPRKVDDEFSKKIYISIINNLDPYKLYFTQTDINKLNDFEDKIDDEIKSKSTLFLQQVITLYQKRLKYGDSLVNSILSHPLNFSVSSAIVFDKKSTSKYANNLTEINKRWTRWLKYLTLETMSKNHATKEEKNLLSKASLLKYEEESRTKINAKYNNFHSSLIEDYNTYENYIAEMYLNSIATEFDPHSMYFSAETKNYFLGHLSREDKSFGFEFEENILGELLVVRLVPGGPAWKSNQLNKGDILLGIKWDEAEWMDLSFVNTDELENLISFNPDEALLKVRKINGETIIIPLVKEIIRADENIIKSFVLKNEKAIGYISLPGFYTEFESENQLGCANDIAKAIVKMKKENIDGLIIDLRGNGGGSLKEAIELAGIFIDFGPLTIMKSKNSEPITIKDFNRGSIYNDPLLILVNSQSASASELFSATMQDYQRALIVGSPTFGKSTGQDILPLTLSTTNDNKNNPSSGYLKLTLSMFYRLNCISYQKIGVIPDIFLPYLFHNEGDREKDYPSALSSDSISKKIYMPEIKQLPYRELEIASENRINTDSIFTKIKAINQSEKINNKDSLKISLKIDEFIAYKNQLSSNTSDILKDIDSRVTSRYTIDEVTYDNDLLKTDKYTKEINKITIEQLNKDIYLEEAYNILLDLIKIKNN
ncbi:MAG: carboxy terminal-processing peptidase [Vicingus serpentipes]|nr:carboxy terminal-processing peptidase [Vicingus serpentipes]